MEKIDIINNILKISFINIYVYYVYIKIINYKNVTFYKIIIAILSSLFFALIYTILIQYTSAAIAFPIIYFLQSIILSYINKNNLNYSVVVVSISFVLVYILYLISIIISSPIAKMIFNVNSTNNIIILFVAIAIEYLLLKLLFRIKRFKNGFGFLNYSDTIAKIGIYCILFLGIVLIFCGLLQGSENILLNTYISAGIVIVIIVFIIWIQSQITLRYKENMKDRTIELQNEEIEKQSKEIEELKQENLKISSIVHQYNHRLSALEQAIVNKLNNNMKIESSSELAIMLDEVKNMSKEFAKEVETPINNPLPKTNIMEIDHMFQYMEAKAKENNIQFELIINHSIHYLTENIITKEELETLIGDHISDAIIAINANHTDKRKIMCILGKIEDYYELCIYDTGINFEIETLINLGRKRITTHKEEGGSGIGFMTSFETLRKCKGSLIIDEYCSKDAYYTKSISFRFDGKNEYKIHSPRAEEIKEKDKENRIIIEK